MAERLLSHALAAENPPLNTIQVRSAGVSAFPGDAPSANAVTALRKVGLDLSDHRSSTLSPQLLQTTDLLLGMTSQHLEAVRLLFPETNLPMFRFREWTSGHPADIPDPFGAELARYLEARDHIAEAIPGILAHLRSLFSS